MIVEVADAAATTELRRAVLRPQWPPGSAMHGDGQPDAIHLAARDADGILIGACVLFPRPCPARPDEPRAWQLRGMAAVPPGRGTGTALTEAAVAEVTRRGGRLIWCDARESAVAFYRARGFDAVGEIYAHPETGAPHLLMLRELPDRSGSSTG